MIRKLILKASPLAALMLAACAQNLPPAADAEDIQRAVDHAEQELASAKAAAQPIGVDVSG